ncbi:MAG: hypothetical protein LQ346_000075 [Caloplaca aetnensis]|nr:MAG: hypothetical protein LQ346_000075 [Caloplaca aetnensis]
MTIKHKEQSRTGDGPRPTKRLKTDHGSSIPSLPTTEASTTEDPELGIASNVHAPPTTATSLPDEVHHLQGQYEFSTMSIISSSKISTKAKTLIERVEKFTFANVNAKPGVVVVTAKAPVASKMISVVEIGKGDITRRGGKWYEYSKLQSELLEVKSKQKQRPMGGRTSADMGNAQAASHPANAELDHPLKDATSDRMEMDEDDPEDGGVAFEILEPPAKDILVSERPKVRSTPVMTIYFSCVPVPGLKALYG